MPVPNDEWHRIRMIVWGWALEGIGREDIEVKLRLAGIHEDREMIWLLVVRADAVLRTRKKTP